VLIKRIPAKLFTEAEVALLAALETMNVAALVVAGVKRIIASIFL